MFSKHLQEIRKFEIDKALQFFPPKSRVLEIGAGAGWQAKIISEHNFEVSAIDVYDSQYLANAIFPIIIYDGKTIPFPNDYFDVVFSSNTLEHIPNVVSFQREIHRVCKPDGWVIHFIPTGSWRFWTNITYYLFLIIRAPQLIHSYETPVNEGFPISRPSSRKKIIRKIISKIIPKRHGHFGNCLTEIYYFSRFRWTRLFYTAGFREILVYPNNLFYTGNNILNSTLRIYIRKVLSVILGSSCSLYVMRNSA